jgi:hypothetical protein
MEKNTREESWSSNWLVNANPESTGALKAQTSATSAKKRAIGLMSAATKEEAADAVTAPLDPPAQVVLVPEEEVAKELTEEGLTLQVILDPPLPLNPNLDTERQKREAENPDPHPPHAPRAKATRNQTAPNLLIPERRRRLNLPRIKDLAALTRA